MTHLVVITLTARNAIAAHAPGGALRGARPVGQDLFEIELDDEVFARLSAIDADISRAIRLVCSGQFGTA